MEEARAVCRREHDVRFTMPKLICKMYATSTGHAKVRISFVSPHPVAGMSATTSGTPEATSVVACPAGRGTSTEVSSLSLPDGCCCGGAAIVVDTIIEYQQRGTGRACAQSQSQARARRAPLIAISSGTSPRMFSTCQTPWQKEQMMHGTTSISFCLCHLHLHCSAHDERVV